MQFSTYKLPAKKVPSGRPTVFQTPEKYNAITRINQQTTSIKSIPFRPPGASSRTTLGKKSIPKTQDEEVCIRRKKSALRKGLFHVDMLTTTNNFITPPRGMKHFEQANKSSETKRSKSVSKLANFTYYLQSDQVRESFLECPTTQHQRQPSKPKDTEYNQKYGQSNFSERSRVKSTRQFDHAISSDKVGFYLR